MISTANLFAEKKHIVSLLVLDHTSETYYQVHPDVKIIHAPMDFGITEKGNALSRKIKMWRDIRKLKRVLKELQPDHLICSEYPFAVGAILGGVKKFSRVYSWEHHHYKAQHLNRFWQFFLKRTYKKLDAVICLNTDEQRYYREFNNNAVVIPNFINPSSSPIEPGKKFDLLSVTRFNHIKGIDLLEQVARIIFRFKPGLKWKVIGYGEQQDIFLDFIEKEKLSGQIVFQPADKTDLTTDYQTAGVFIMTSRNECFPLVLLEAMSNGLPCIAFDCDTGPRHIIEHEKTGLLVSKENVNAMASIILQLLSDTSMQQRMSEQALLAVRDYYPDKVYELWKQLLS